MKKCKFEQCKYDNSIFYIHLKNKHQLCEKEFCPLQNKNNFFENYKKFLNCPESKVNRLNIY